MHFRDSLGRIWAGTEGGGLALFNRTEDRFRPVHLAWNLPGDAIVSIIEDNSGILWLGSNAGLIRLSVADDAENALFRLLQLPMAYKTIYSIVMLQLSVRMENFSLVAIVATTVFALLKLHYKKTGTIRGDKHSDI